jgi:DNA-binding beta-propeller fold protein YncE
VDRWVRNFSVSVAVMFTSESCMSLFIDTYDRLYCSLDARSRIIRTSLLHDINRTETVAGNGSVGLAGNMLNRPRGIFVDLNMTLYVADCFNSRVQQFRSGERNGTTVAGNGAPGTVILNKPIAVILDGNGFLFIADAARNHIVASGPNGFRCIIGCGAGIGVLNSPGTIHFDSGGNLLVMESGNSRLQKFLMMNNSCGE